MKRSSKRIAVVFVEGQNDIVFIEEVLLKSFGKICVEKAELANLNEYVRVALYSDGDQAIITQYAGEGGYARALRVAAVLCGQAVSIKDVVKRSSFLFLVLVDENHSKEKRLAIARQMIEFEAKRFRVEFSEESRGWAVRYVAKHRRTGGQAIIAVSIVECSLECQVVKHVLRDYNSFCNKSACHSLLDNMEQEHRFERIKELVEILEESGDDWYRNLKWAITAP